MRYLLLLCVLGMVLVVTSTDAEAQGRRFGRRHVSGAVPYYGVPVYGYSAQGRFSSADPYSLHFRHPQPHQYGRWDLYFNMHGAPYGIGF